MKKIIYKTALFSAPFFLAFLYTFCFYTTKKGDLLRLGYIPDISGYNSKEVFKEEFSKKINYTLFSNLDIQKSYKFNVITIGDSFSEQGNIGYQNLLAENKNVKVLHLDRFLHDNPIETVHSFLNGNIFDTIKVDYIVLQSVERVFVERGLNLKTKNVTKLDSITKLIKIDKEKSIKEIKAKNKDMFFCRETLKFPLYTIKFYLDDNAYNSETYQVETKTNLFSTNNKKLLFFEDDLKVLDLNNNIQNIEKLNNELNFLAKQLTTKGIKLIVLPCPDKFDFYYDEIITKEKYPKPIFYDYLRQLKKEYIYIDAKKILKEKTQNKKDVYFYDDTHWSPIAVRIISNKLDEIIENK